MVKVLLFSLLFVFSGILSQLIFSCLFAFILMTKVCVSFTLAHYKYLAFLYLSSLFLSLLKSCHRNLVLLFGPCCSVSNCITFSALYGLLLVWPFFSLNIYCCDIFFFPFLLKRLNNWCFRWSIPKYSAFKSTNIVLPNGLYYVAYCSILNNLKKPLCYVSSSVLYKPQHSCYSNAS